MSDLCPWPFDESDAHRPHPLDQLPRAVLRDPRFGVRLRELVGQPESLTSTAARYKAGCEVFELRRTEEVHSAPVRPYGARDREPGRV